VKSGHSVEYVLRHPAVGMLTVTQQTLTASQAPEQSLVTCTTGRGSSSFEAVKLLAQLVGSSSAARDYPSTGDRTNFWPEPLSGH
jgi:hypothetical protein